MSAKANDSVLESAFSALSKKASFAFVPTVVAEFYALFEFCCDFVKHATSSNPEVGGIKYLRKEV